MIEPYSLNANWSCKLKRHHKLIFEMWENYATYKEIVDRLAEVGCRTCTQSVCTYVTRCLLEEGEPHVFERRKPIEFNGRKAWAKLLDRHEEIINLRYYQGYTLNEIAKIMEVAPATLWKYIAYCEGRL